MSHELEYQMVKAVKFMKANGEGELQYTLGPVYAPGQVDAHGEHISDDVLHKAMLDYSLSGDRNLRLQHNPNVVSGQWVEMMRLPGEATWPVTKADGTKTDVTFPSGTVMMGVRWSDDAWPLVKAGKIGGLSMGGRAVRVKGQAVDAPGLPPMGYAAVSNPGSSAPEGALALGKAAAGATPGISATGNGDTQPLNVPQAESQQPSFANPHLRDVDLDPQVLRHPDTGRFLAAGRFGMVNPAASGKAS